MTEKDWLKNSRGSIPFVPKKVLENCHESAGCGFPSEVTGRSAASKATTTKAIKKNATGAKPAAKESKAADKKMSQIEAAIAVLAKPKQPMNRKSMVEAMQVEGLWASPGCATPDATLYASIPIKAKDSRFKKVDRGLFALNGKK